MHTLLLQAITPFTPDFFINLYNQGPVITLLVAAVYYFYRRDKQRESELKTTNEKLETYMRDDRGTLLTALQNNTRVMEENTMVIKELLDKHK